MVYLGNKKFGSGRRVGQAANATGNGTTNAFNAQRMLNSNGNGIPNISNARPFVSNAQAPTQAMANGFMGPDANEGYVYPASEFTAAGATYDPHPETLTINQLEGITGADVDAGAATDSDGNPVNIITITTQDGTVTSATVPAPVAAPPAAEVCEFPAQAVQLQRDVIITNTAPEIVDVETDVCGNVIRFRESITRNMQATSWQAVSGLDAGVNGIMDFQVNGQGRIASTTNPNLFLANSLSVPPRINGATPTVNVAAGRVGKKPNYVGGNAAYGAAAMRRFHMG